MERLANKIVLITGAANGIGKAIAELFHQEGAVVILSDIEDSKGRICTDNLGDRATYLHLDVSKEPDWIDALNTIKQDYGKLDVLVNNAGIGGFTQTSGPHVF